MSPPTESPIAASALPVRIAVSSCLLGQSVRYDGGHKQHRWLVQELGAYVQVRALCPEVAVGLGVPRPPIHLVRRRDGVHAVGVDEPKRDLSDRLRAYARTLGNELHELCGYVFKRGSPSCGLSGVPIRVAQNGGLDEGTGLFAEAVCGHAPTLPAEEEAGLDDPTRRNRFLVRVFARHRWQEMCRHGASAASLADFHARNELLLRVHDEALCRKLGRLAGDRDRDLAGLVREYESGMATALQRLATREQHCSVIMHLLDLAADQLASTRKRALLESVEEYRRGSLSLYALQSLLAGDLRGDSPAWYAGELYLQPYPAGLRNPDG